MSDQLKRAVGRPPLHEPTEVIALRIPCELADRLTAYIKLYKRHTGMKTSKNQVGIKAITDFLDAKEDEHFRDRMHIL